MWYEFTPKQFQKQVQASGLKEGDMFEGCLIDTIDEEHYQIYLVDPDTVEKPPVGCDCGGKHTNEPHYDWCGTRMGGEDEYAI